MPKITFDSYKTTDEYKMWLHIENLCEQYELTGDNYIVRKDIGGVFWEPLWDRMFKFGIMLKHVPKSIKYIKGEWMRPLLYLESQSNDIVTFDGVKYKIDKTANSAAVNLRVALRNLLNSLTMASKMTNESFNNDYKKLKEDDKYFFKMLNAYVKEGYRSMHENIKDILFPLRLLRKGGYRLFSYDERINKNIDLNMFKSKEQMTIFLNSVKEEFKQDEILQAKNNTPEELEEIMKRETQASVMRYSYNEEKIVEEKKDLNPYDSIALKSEKNPKTAKQANEIAKKKFELQQKAIQDKEDQMKRELLFPNLENLTQSEIIKFERDALVADFEKGFKAMLVYLNEKFPLQIPEIIDPHKLTVNLENIPKNLYETNFYMEKLNKILYDLKKMCYEMKLNGLSRILLPITANIEFTTQVKMVYDLHVSIDRLMGDKLKLQQYSFIFNEINFLSKSNFKDEMFFFKDKKFMEIGVSKFIFYQALCNSVQVMEKMRKNNRLNGIKYDNIDNYFQTTKLNLDTITDFNSYNLHNFDDYIAEETKAYSSELQKQTKLDRITLNEELKQIGRFFILENFIDPDQKDNWIELTTQLIEINSSVREDIKEYLLRSSSIRVKEHKPGDSKANSRVSSRVGSRRNSRASSRSPSIHVPGKYLAVNNQGMTKSAVNPQKSIKKNQIHSNAPSTTKSNMKSPKKDWKNKKEMSMDNVLEDSSKNLIIVKDIKISRFKPPFVWNFPIERIRELQKKNKRYEISTTSIDFNTIYKDGRVEKFLELFDAVFNSCMKYCQEKLRNNWEYMLYKQYEIFDIKYQPFIDKFFRKIDLKPPEPSNEGEKEVVEDENKEENKEGEGEEEKNEEYKEEVIPTEINVQETEN